MSVQDFHVPTGELVESGGQSQMRYITRLELASHERMQEQIATILDANVEAWMSSDFSGDVYLACWNDQMQPAHMQSIAGGLGTVLNELQGVIDENHITTASGHRVKLQATLSQTEREARA